LSHAFESVLGLEYSGLVTMAASPKNLMVPSARLELAQLSPLPPQDSVSTNFTTTA
jgi:hypothetical protein